MFAWWGRMVYRYRFIVIGAFVAVCLGSGLFGINLGKHVTQGGFYNDDSDSVRASLMADDALGRDRTSHVVAIIAAPEGKTVDDAAFQKQIVDHFDQLAKDNPKQIYGWAGWVKAPTAPSPVVQRMVSADRKHTFVSISLQGNDDDSILNNYKALADPDQDGDPSKNKFLLDGVNIKLAGLEPVAAELTGTVGKDTQRMEVASLPIMAVVLFFVFGGVIAAGLPLMVGGLTIAAATGVMELLTKFIPVNFFCQPVVSLIGLGIAIDYSLFMVSRFREEIAEGYDTETAVRRTVVTSGRTVMFSATLIVGALIGMLVVPQPFLKSLTYAGISSVMISATLAVTVLPACLGVLGRHVDALSWKRFSRTRPKEEIENGFWGRTVVFVMKRPLVFAVPIVIVMLLLIIPLKNLTLGGFSEKYLPPSNTVRMAQEEFDKLFPGFRTQPVTIVTKGATDAQLAQIRADAMKISGFVNPTGDPKDRSQMWAQRLPVDPKADTHGVKVIQNPLINENTAAEKIKELREIPAPRGVTLLIGGTDALVQDSIDVVFDKLPIVIFMLVSLTTVLMFLAFGSLVLPIKAAVMSALGLGSTMGILTWIFVDGHFSRWLGFTPTPLTAPVIVLIIVVIYGLSSDYEVFLMSRMIEARAQGCSTAEAVRVGTAHTGRIITAAALILIVVAGGFVLSDLVMMKYLAFGLISALILDATVVRMLLIPAVMKLLGDDCWWAPAWMKRIQVRLGLGEITLPDERKRPTGREQAVAAAASPAGSHDRTTKLQLPVERTRLPSAPRQHDPGSPARPTTPPAAPSAGPATTAAPTTKQPQIPPAKAAPAAPAGADAPPTTAIPQAGAPQAKPAQAKPVPPKPAQPAPTQAKPGQPTPGQAKPAQPTPAQPKPQQTQPPQNTVGAETTRIQLPGNAPGNAGQPPRRSPEREIESWLGELRGPKQGNAAPGDATTAIPVPKRHPSGPIRTNGTPGDSPATTAIPVPPQDKQASPDQTQAMPAQDPDRTTKQPAPSDKDKLHRNRSGGVSAQDLLRREGRRL